MTRFDSSSDHAMRAQIATAAAPLPDLNDPGFGAAFDAFADARVLLLGESTHGTSEFYRARAAITRHLIERHGVRVVAFEADWPDMAALDRWARADGPPPGADAFARFPTWMWRNQEFARFAGWLRQHNARQPAASRVALRGLDLYSIASSVAAVLRYLDQADPDAAAEARRRYGCLTPYQDRPFRYGQEAEHTGMAKCEAAVLQVLRDLLAKRLEAVAQSGDMWLDAVGNARVVADAEAYYRAAYRGGPESWNLRDRHMARILDDVLVAAGPGSRAVVWAHNSHVGDATATEMGREGQLTLGQLCREAYGSNASLIGFGTARGTVMAAPDWDEESQVEQVRQSLPGSWEHLFAEAAPPHSLLDLRDMAGTLPGRRLERAIGVVYRPATERWSHYFEAELPRQFDGWVWFDRTSAVTPLPRSTAETDAGAAAETWPTGL